jgi:hypothetical protein
MLADVIEVLLLVLLVQAEGCRLRCGVVTCVMLAILMAAAPAAAAVSAG